MTARRTSRRTSGYPLKKRVRRISRRSFHSPEYIVDVTLVTGKKQGTDHYTLASAMRRAKAHGRSYPAIVWKHDGEHKGSGDYRPYAVVIERKIAYFGKP